jgi:GNAT superfamily N-acetyltransferase
MADSVIWAIRRAEAEDADALPALENSAGTVFRDIPALAWLADGEDLPVERYREFIAGGASWVAVDMNDKPIAFLSGSIEGDALHIWELGVRRDLQRLGIGRALLHAAIREARCRDLVSVTLTTFREVPWNAPFYERLGFERLVGEAIGDRLKRVLRADAERGLPVDARCAMRLWLS